VLSFDDEKVSGGEDEGVETHMLRCSDRGIVLRKSSCNSRGYLEPR
jgi:hypothetical protein